MSWIMVADLLAESVGEGMIGKLNLEALVGELFENDEFLDLLLDFVMQQMTDAFGRAEISI